MCQSHRASRRNTRHGSYVGTRKHSNSNHETSVLVYRASGEQRTLVTSTTILCLHVWMCFNCKRRSFLIHTERLFYSNKWSINISMEKVEKFHLKIWFQLNCAYISLTHPGVHKFSKNLKSWLQTPGAKRWQTLPYRKPAILEWSVILLSGAFRISERISEIEPQFK